METVDINITNATLPPANHLLRPLIDSAQPRNNIREEEIQDKMMIDEQHPGDEMCIRFLIAYFFETKTSPVFRQ
ncbi:hypothetical protein RMCBS344292_00058 [Rhizopus microsporus]|nr:hypothetical protein RMCBS344292_00058 [Rhizopus microsporus]